LELRRLKAAGKLTGAAADFMADRTPPEELFEIGRDPHEVRNLAADPAHRAVRDRLAAELRAWILRTRDTGFLPEDDMARRADGGSPYDIPRERFPLERILDAAELCGRGPEQLPKLRSLLGDTDQAVRHWAAVGLCALGAGAAPAAPDLRRALADAAPSVRVAAAEALAGCGNESDALPVLGRLVCDADSRVAMQAAVALWYVGPKAGAVEGELRKALAIEGGPAEQRAFAKRTLQKTLDRMRPA
jgi:uncharacterized sulfatase